MKSTKKALLLSMMSMLLCVAMLMGTTFAWFTDSVTSGKNKIVAGNLDIELDYSKDGTTWQTVEGDTKLFDDVALWEPGATSVVYLRLTNKGTLALKYNLAITATGGEFTNVAGETKNLKNALKFAQIAGSSLTTYTTREAAVAATESLALGLSDYEQANNMAAEEVSYITLVVTMPTTVDNEFNYKTGTSAPEIDLGITLVATQLASEKDSFGNDYDADAVPGIKIADGLYRSEVDANAYTVTNANGLAKFNELYNTTSMGAVSFELAADIDMTGKTWTPIASLVSGEITPSNKITKIDGNGFKIKNLTIGEHSVAKNANGMILAVANDLIVKDLVVEAPKMNTTKNNVGIIVGQVLAGTTTFDNVIVNNADITAGKKIGTIVGIVNDENAATHEKVVINNCSVAGSKFNNTDTEDSYTGTLVGWVADTLYGAEIEINGTCNVSPAAVTYPESCTTIMNAKLYMHSYGPYKCVDELDNVKLPVATSAELAQALENAAAGDTIIVSSAMSAETPITIPSFDKAVIIKGDGQTHFVAGNDEYGSSAASLPEGATFEDMIIDCGSALYHGFHHAGKITFNRCTFTGTYQGYGDTDFNDCTFNQPIADKYSIWFYGNKIFNLTNCHFYGVDKNTYIYPDMCVADTVVNFTNCDFHMSAESDKAAVMLNQCQTQKAGIEYVVTFTDCTYFGGVCDEGGTPAAGNSVCFGLYGIKSKHPNSSSLNALVTAIVTVDGEEKYNHVLAN